MRNGTFTFFRYGAAIPVVLITAVFVPVTEVRLLLAAVVFVLAGLFFMRRAICFTAAGVLIFSIVVVMTLKNEQVQVLLLNRGVSVLHGIDLSGDAGSAVKLPTDRDIASRATVNISGRLFKLSFVPGKTGISVSRRVKTEMKEETMLITAEGDSEAMPVIELGPDAVVNALSVQGQGIEIVGDMGRGIRTMKCAGADIKISGRIHADVVHLNGAGAEISGDITAKDVVLNGIGMKMNTKVSSETFTLRGVGMEVTADIESVSAVTVSGMGGEIVLRYKDTWRDERTIRAEGFGTEVIVKIPEKNAGTLTTSGDVVTVEAY